MTLQRDNEQLSALTDGELDRQGARFLLRRVADDDDMRRNWERFHLARACMQREFTGPSTLVGRVRGAIQSEPTTRTARGIGIQPLARYGLGGALAAGVAVMAVIGLENRVATMPGASESGEQPAEYASQSTALDRQFARQAIPAGYTSDDSKRTGPRSAEISAGARATQDVRRGSRERINRYVIRHGQAVGSNGFASFTPVLTTPSARLGDTDGKPTAVNDGQASTADGIPSSQAASDGTVVGTRRQPEADPSMSPGGPGKNQ